MWYTVFYMYIIPWRGLPQHDPLLGLGGTMRFCARQRMRGEHCNGEGQEEARHFFLAGRRFSRDAVMGFRGRGIQHAAIYPGRLHATYSSTPAIIYFVLDKT